MKRIVALVTTLALLLVVAGCGGAGKSGGSSSGPTEVKVASVSPLSGGQASLGTAIKNGAEMAVKAREKELLDAGYKIVFAPQDDEAKPEVGTQVAQRLAADKAVIGVVGTLNTGVAKGVAPILLREGNGLVMVSPANTGVVMTESGWTNYNRIVFRDDYQGPAAARYAAQVLKVKSAYVMHDKTDYGKALAEEFAKTLQKAGVTVNGPVGVDEKKADYGPEATQAVAKNPDLVYFGGIYDTAGPLFKQIRAKGFKGAFMGGDGLDSGDLVKLGGEAAENTYFTSVSADYKSGSGKEFHDKYVATYKDEPAAYALYGYDCMNILLQTLLDYGKKNGGKVPARADFAQLVRNTKNFKAISSTVSFDSKGDNPTSKVFVFKVKGGKFEDLGAAPEK
ncbi:MAG TPA: branched-chain amino acid ABC transporter substrate-binding protein [Symbiobacteriaceae bacterium]|jgi:branched-chain amino acid transport system substrate-binding protein|nr:branched-chain amino acid ABC transporter substrate-binding protein [Symbiobacteriaceae bacterium]